MFTRQSLILGAGCLAAFALSFFDYHRWRKLVVPVMLLTILMLVAVLLMKDIRFGSARALFDGSVQPGELAKLVSVIYLSVWLYAKRESLHVISFGLLPLGVILGIVGGLILAQPDISTAGTVLIMGGLLFFLAGGDWKQIGLILVATFVVAWMVVMFTHTGEARLKEFVAGIKDPLSASYQVLRSFEAIVRGGFFGMGLGKSLVKMTGLPLAWSDSIFAVIVEELGVVGVIVLIGLYATLVWRGMVIARRAPDMLGTLLASGLAVWIGLEALVNMTVMVGLMPFAGNVLPFIGYGGSSMTTSLAAVGILLNISRQRGAGTQVEEENEWRAFGATVDLRGRNGRRRVSRPRRVRSVTR
jgi:cell division protein FtsW